MLGHNYSPWVGFKGGKGIATSAGVLLALMPAAVVSAGRGLAGRFPRHPLCLAGQHRRRRRAAADDALWGSMATTDGSQDGTWNKPLFFFSLVIAILAIWKHRSNIERLRAGTEHRFTRKPKSADV